MTCTSLDKCSFPLREGTSVDSRRHIADSHRRWLSGVTPWSTNSDTEAVQKDVFDVSTFRHTADLLRSWQRNWFFFLALCLMAHYRFCVFFCVFCTKTPMFCSWWCLWSGHAVAHSRLKAYRVVVTGIGRWWPRSSQTFLRSCVLTFREDIFTRWHSSMFLLLWRWYFVILPVCFPWEKLMIRWGKKQWANVLF